MASGTTAKVIAGGRGESLRRSNFADCPACPFGIDQGDRLTGLPKWFVRSPEKVARSRLSLAAVNGDGSALAK
jgi:hypothetical protein